MVKEKSTLQNHLEDFFEENNPNIDDDDIFVGRQFIGLLYQRSDPTGSGGTTKNYQFDDISQNIIHIKENLDNFMVGDTIVEVMVYLLQPLLIKNLQVLKLSQKVNLLMQLLPQMILEL